jgi:hypothetical protein
MISIGEVVEHRIRVESFEIGVSVSVVRRHEKTAHTTNSSAFEVAGRVTYDPHVGALERLTVVSGRSFERDWDQRTPVEVIVTVRSCVEFDAIVELECAELDTRVRGKVPGEQRLGNRGGRGKSADHCIDTGAERALPRDSVSEPSEVSRCGSLRRREQLIAMHAGDPGMFEKLRKNLPIGLPAHYHAACRLAPGYLRDRENENFCPYRPAVHQCSVDIPQH